MLYREKRQRADSRQGMRTKEPHRKSYWAALLVVLLAGLAVAALPAGVVASEAGELPPDLVMPETPEAAASAREAATAARRLDLERYLPRSAADQFPRPDEQGRLELSVEEAVVMALANNRSLGIQLYRPLISGTFAEQERAVFDPTLFAEASAGR